MDSQRSAQLPSYKQEREGYVRVDGSCCITGIAIPEKQLFREVQALAVDMFIRCLENVLFDRGQLPQRTDRETLYGVSLVTRFEPSSYTNAGIRAASTLLLG